MAGTIEIFSKQFLGSDYTQTINEAVDTGGSNFGSLQIWIDGAAMATGSGTLTVTVQHANSNDADSYLDVATTSATWEKAFTLTTTASSQVAIEQWSAGFGQFLRLSIVFSASAHANVRAVLVLKDSV